MWKAKPAPATTRRGVAQGVGSLWGSVRVEALLEALSERGFDAIRVFQEGPESVRLVVVEATAEILLAPGATKIRCDDAPMRQALAEAVTSQLGSL